MNYNDANTYRTHSEQPMIGFFKNRREKEIAEDNAFGEALGDRLADKLDAEKANEPKRQPHKSSFQKRGERAWRRAAAIAEHTP